MRVLLIYPNIDCQIGFNYGLAFISSVLQRAGHETKLLNVNEKLDFPLDFDRIRREVKEFSPDLVGFSVVTTQYEPACRIAETVRLCCDAPIVCGGIHPTMAPRQTLKDDCWDFICVGEGEDAVLEMVERIENDEPLKAIDNLGYREDGEVVRNPVRPFKDLGELPPKDYDLFDFQKMVDAKNGWVGLMTSRGCPFRCSYCFNHRMVDLYKEDTGRSRKDLNYIRWHPVDEVIEEIEYLLDNYRNINMFIFDDDVITLDKDYLRELCRRYEEVCDVPFVCNAHVKMFDRDRAEMLKSAGCRIVKFGLESGSERVRREIMHRRMSNKEIDEAFQTAHEVGLETSAFVMLGLPGETMGELDDTLDLLAKIGPSRFRWSIFFPFYNTDAYDMSVEGGYIDSDAMHRLTNFMDASCLDFGPKQNLRIRKLRRTIPWEVNMRAGHAPEVYGPMVERINKMDEEEWSREEDDFPEIDHKVSRALLEEDQPHYAIKYNEFMGVLEPDKETLEERRRSQRRQEVSSAG